jgi:hypothetical protein
VDVCVLGQQVSERDADDQWSTRFLSVSSADAARHLVWHRSRATVQPKTDTSPFSAHSLSEKTTSENNKALNSNKRKNIRSEEEEEQEDPFPAT